MSNKQKFKNQTPEQIEAKLLMVDVGGRFDGDVEFLTLVWKKEKTPADENRMMELLRNAGVPLGFKLRRDDLL